jgi:hypothetical protein
MEIYLEVGRGVKLWERALQNGLWLAGTPCEAKILRTFRCITEESMPEVNRSLGDRNVGAYQIQGLLRS